MKQSHRADMISELACVDYVVVFGGLTVRNVIRTIRPDVHAKGGDYTEDSVPEGDDVRSYGGKVKIAGGGKVDSTTLLIQRVHKLKK